MSAKRIASLLASGTEIVCSLGLDDRLVAISHECDHPPHITDRPRVTMTTVNADACSGDIDRQVRRHSAQQTSIYRIDVDKLAALNPDLIVTQAHCEVCAVSDRELSLAARRVPSLLKARAVSLRAATLNGIFADIEGVGDAAGASAAALHLNSSLRARVAAVQQCVSHIPMDQRPRVACVEWLDPVMIAANWIPELIELAGGISGLTRTGRRSSYTDWNSVLAYDPQVIVIMPCGFDLARTLKEWSVLCKLPGWNRLAAVRGGRVYTVDGNAYFNRSGPRMIDSLELLARLIHPDCGSMTNDTMATSWQCASESIDG